MTHPNPGDLNLEFGRYVSNDVPKRFVHYDSEEKLELVERWALKEHFQPHIDKLQAEQEHGRVNVAESRQSIRDKVRGTVKYAVLSHRWLNDELTLQDFGKKRRLRSIGWNKVARFCGEAARQGISFFWIDTCCIDKTSSTELDEAIRSMFRWYQNSALCIVHLAQTTSLTDMSNDEWFRRGWTLQELLAPKKIHFFDWEWKRLSIPPSQNDKEECSDVLSIASKATKITITELCHFTPSPSNVDERMTWTARRDVTRGEDWAYSLMGVFDVSISTAYGEGAERAFCRLVEAIMMAGGDPSVLNWSGIQAAHHATQCLPSSPRSYLGYPRRSPENSTKLDIALTSRGLRVPLIILPLTLEDSTDFLDEQSRGVYRFSIQRPIWRKGISDLVVQLSDDSLFPAHEPSALGSPRIVYALGVISYNPASFHSASAEVMPAISSPIIGYLLQGSVSDSVHPQMLEKDGKRWTRVPTDFIGLSFKFHSGQTLRLTDDMIHTVFL